MTKKERRENYRKKYRGRFKEKVKDALRLGYVEMGALNLELAEEGFSTED